MFPFTGRNIERKFCLFEKIISMYGAFNDYSKSGKDVG